MTIKKIRGLELEEEIIDGIIFWNIEIRNPFKGEDNHYWFGLNDKLLETAQTRGVKKLYLKIGEQKQQMSVPDKEDLKEKEKRGEYKDIPSKFKGLPCWRMYHFQI